jgi:hypothetical protein
VALAGPVGMGVVTREFGERWFWLSLLAGIVIHGMAVWSYRADLPFDNTSTSFGSELLK